MADVNPLEIPEEVLDSARMTTRELRTEIAILLYSQGRLSFGKARELAGMPHWEFRQLLGSRQVATHYAPVDLDHDLEALHEL